MKSRVSGNSSKKRPLIVERVNNVQQAGRHSGHYHMNVPCTHAGGRDLIKMEFLQRVSVNCTYTNRIGIKRTNRCRKEGRKEERKEVMK
jgi:hypothetical protein